MQDGFDPLRGFLLKGVKHVNSLCKTDGIDGAKSISGMISDNLQNTRTLSFPLLGRWVLSAKLGHTESGPDGILHCLGESQ